MLVGFLASPNFHFFPLNFESADVELIAVFGLILLLFNLGLEFDQDEFFGNARTLLISGGTRIADQLRRRARSSASGSAGAAARRSSSPA